MASTGFQITIAAVDLTADKLDAINKRISKLSQQAASATKNLATTGEGSVGGIAKLSQGMLSLGSNSLGAFRALEQMVSPMTAITSAASLAGMAALEKQWASAGNTISKTAYALNVPIDKLSNIEHAFYEAGSSAEVADQTMQGLQQTLTDANWGKADGRIVAMLEHFHIGFKGANGQAALAADQIGHVADALLSLGNDPTAQTALLKALGIPEDALVALKNGRQAFEDFMSRARDTGAVTTKEMAAHATELELAYRGLADDLQGIGNRIADNWSGVATSVVKAISTWIEHNKQLSDSFIEIGAGIASIGTAVGGLKLSAAAMRFLGLGALVPSAPVAALGAAAAAGGYGAYVAGKQGAEATNAAGKAGFTEVVSTDDAGNPTAYRNPTTGKTEPSSTFNPNAPDLSKSGGSGWWADHAPTWLGGNDVSPMEKLIAKGEAGAGGYNAVNRGAAGHYSAGMENLANMTVADVMAAQKAHRFNAAGRYQLIGSTLEGAVRDLGLTGKEKFDQATQDRIFKDYLINTKRPEIGAYISGKSDNLPAALLAMSKEWASVADPNTGRSHYAGVGGNKASISSDQAAAALNAARDGAVHVTVDLKGAPAGTRATSTASGSATTSPPRVEMAMAGF